MQQNDLRKLWCPDVLQIVYEVQDLNTVVVATGAPEHHRKCGQNVFNATDVPVGNSTDQFRHI